MNRHLAVAAAMGAAPWPVRPFRRIASLVGDRNESADQPLLSVASTGLVTERVDGGRQASSDSTIRNGWVAQPGDLIVNPMWLIGGGIAVTDIAGAVSPDYRVYRFAPGIHPRFMHHLLRSRPYLDQYRLYTRAETTFDRRVSKDDFHEMPVPVPELHVQRQFAELLDFECARIDALHALRHEQLRLLQERIGAVAREATGNGTAPPPADWVIDKLGRHTRIGNGATPRREDPRFWSEGTVPWLNSSVVNLPVVTSAEQFVTAAAVAECHLPRVRPGSILVGLTGQGRTRGMATMLAFTATVNQHLAFVTPDARYWEPRYLLLLLKGAYASLRNVSDINGSTKGGLTCADLGALRVPRPPLAEQVAIAAEVERRVALIRQSAEAVQRSIDLISERRQALISDVITGRRDVSAGRRVAS